MHEMEPFQEKNCYHGLMDERGAESKLNGAREQSFLLRKNLKNVLIISYNSKQKTKHVTLPTNKSSIIRQNNNHLNTPESLFEYVHGKTHLTTLTYPVLREDFPVNSNYVEHDINCCDICGEHVGQNKLSTHKEKSHRITECRICQTILFPFASTRHKQNCAPESVRDAFKNDIGYILGLPLPPQTIKD